MGGIHAFLKGTNRLYCFFGAGDLVKEIGRVRTVERARHAKPFLQPRHHQSLLVDHKTQTVQC